MSLKTMKSMIGNASAVAQLARAAEQKMPNHAYLIVGDPGSGKRHLAEAFATALLCKGPGADACGRCDSCRKAEGHNHPDILHIPHEKPDTFSVGEVRDQIVGTASIRPYESDFKVYIVPDAEKMNAQAQNALLKTIEEPPAYVVILLLSNNADAMLPTIRSRCVELHMSALPDAELCAHVRQRYGLAEEAADAIAALAQGNLGRAKEMAEKGAVTVRIAAMRRMLRRIPDMDAAERKELIDEIRSDRAGMTELFSLMTLWFRDVLLFKATRDADRCRFREEISEIRETAKHCSYEGLDEILEAIGTAERRICANVGEELTLELLLLTLRDRLS